MNTLAHSLFNSLRLLALMASLLLTPQLNAQSCDRNCVLVTVNSYVTALMAHDPSLVDLSANPRSTENGVDVMIGEGIWNSLVSQGGYRQTFVDDSLNSAVFFGAFTEQTDAGEARLLLAIRFAFEDGKITELEHMLSRPDERNRLINRHSLTGPNPVYEEILPDDQRSTRAELIAAGHAYFDGIANSTDEGVPMDRYCHRRENGVTLLSNPEPENQACPTGFARFAYITDIRDRRVAVVDEARGLVLLWAFFDVPGNVDVSGSSGPSDVYTDGQPDLDTRRLPRSLYIAELFRVIDGNIREIEAIMFNLDFGSKSGWE
jgi:hypothetical protein